MMKHLATFILAACAILFLPVVSAQVAITGKVVDAKTEQPFPGVQVIGKGTLSGTTTDSEGRYSISVPEVGSTLVFRFVGYSTQEFPVLEGMRQLDVRLFESILGLEEVVVIGSRRLPRLVKESAVPVDVFGPRDIASQSSTDMDDILRTQIPSFNVQRHGIDAEATLVRPVTLRGLPADNVVVLVNGKRRHRSASMALFGNSLITGSQGADMNMIPGIAMKQIEVLRDGATAQYGADAVAGVFNIQLRDNRRGAHVWLQGGQHGKGDGTNYLAAANIGLPLTRRGFLNLSLEYHNADPTVRSGVRWDEGILNERGYPVRNPAQIWGSPKVSHSIVGFLNTGLDLGSNTHVYAFGGYGHRQSEGGFYFRAPGTGIARSAVFRNGSARAVADLNENDEVICSELPDLPGLDADFAAVSAFIDKYGLRGAGQCFLFNEKFPGGFTPQFGADIYDLSATAGIRGGADDGVRWDVSFAYGNSDINYFIYNTVNASMGPDTPTSFRPTGFAQQELTASAGGSVPVRVRTLETPLNISFGLEWHTEQFTTAGGDEASYLPGGYESQGFSVGANGYQGLSPKFAGSWGRPNLSGYIDLETDLNPRWTFGVAARYENYYKGFGATLTGKIAALFRATDRIRLRGTASTGFRAPTPGQANLWILQTTLSKGNQLVEAGQLPPTHPISSALGGEELTEETARSLSLGTVMDLSSDLTLTLDYFDITLEDRISLTGNIVISQEIQDIMDEADLLGGVENLQEVKFFSNDFGTRTRGTDLLLAYDTESEAGNATQATIAWNWTASRLISFSAPREINTFLDQKLSSPFTISLLTPRRQIEIERLNPKHRIVMMGRHIRGAISGMLRLNYYGSWAACRINSNKCQDNSGMSLLDEYDAAIIVDAELGYRLFDRYRVSFSVDNLFNTVPDAHKEETLSQGNAHPESTPWDYNGSTYALRLTADIF